MYAQQAAAGETAIPEIGARRSTHRARALRRRRGCLHRRSCLHPALRLPVTVRQAHRQSAQGRSGCGHRQQLRRLRQLRRGVGSGRPLPVFLSRRHHPQSDLVRSLHVGRGPVGDRFSATPPRSAAYRFCGLTRKFGIMNDLSGTPTPTRYTTERPICIAVMAMGGQGGGVLADWIVELAESQSWHAQSTSVPGVAQRTGATIYYVEMLPPKAGRAPILSLMPAPGEVDIVLAAELIEAGRSILRGLVTPDRTTLIASTHRLYSTAEKEKPGDATADPNVVVEAAGVAAKRVVAFDMETLATKNNSMISACLFGALAAAGTLPFPRDAFEAIIKSGGRGIETSLKAFKAAHDQVAQPQAARPVLKRPSKHFAPLPATAGRADLDKLLARIREYPES